MITARVIADSIYEGGIRLTTMIWRYPRFIHSEVMTHRMFSRNASSSRAIPVEKMIAAVMADPAMPVFWGKNQPGMQAAEELAMYIPVPEGYKGEKFMSLSPKLPGPRMEAQAEWLKARDHAVEHVKKLMEIGLHKQIANRILEPWMHIEVVVTATDWANFYALRRDKNAQPEMQALANAAFEVHSKSVPRILKPGEWHLPFVSLDEQARTLDAHEFIDWELLCKISAARCARVSYLKHDGTKASVNEDLELFNRLMGGEIKHASPTEHQAKVPRDQEESEHYRSNLYRWVSFRKLIPGENISEFKEFKR